MPTVDDQYNGATLNFGRRVKSSRKKRGLTQSELGEIVGVSKTTIQNYESNRIPKGLYLFKLSRALRCSIDYLLLGEESPYVMQEMVPEKPFGMDEKELAECRDWIKSNIKNPVGLHHYDNIDQSVADHIGMIQGFRDKDAGAEFVEIIQKIEEIDQKSFYEALGWAKNELKNIERYKPTIKKRKLAGK